MLTSKQLRKELLEILRNDFGMEISEKEAFEIACDLVNLFDELLQSEGLLKINDQKNEDT